MLAAAFAGAAWSQEVVIADFPLGIAGSIDPAIFKPYQSQLKAIADTLGKYPLMRAVITGGADGEEYRQYHDAKNPSLALGRAHILRNLLIGEFKVDSSQLIVQSEDVRVRGAQHRYAGIRIDRGLYDLEARIDSLEKRPPIEKHFTEVKEPAVVSAPPPSLEEELGVQFGAGISSSPFNLIPVATAAVSWKRTIYLEGLFGHTFWNDIYKGWTPNLATKRRMLGINTIVYPYSRVPVGVVGGWIRIEEVSQDYYEYVRLSEGPMLGLRVTPLEFLSITGLFNPSKHRKGEQEQVYLSESKNGQFLLYATVHISFGGAR